MATVECPECGEDDRLRGNRRGDEAIVVTCEVCGHTWERNLRKRCVYCGSKSLRFTPMPLWSRGRGTMQTAAGQRDAWTCEDCGATDCTRERS